MATQIAQADGNFTAAIWGLVVDVSASLLNSQVGNTAMTTSYVESQALTPGAVTIDGIAVKVASRVASPTGTISIRLAQAGVLVAGTEVTINVSDIASRNGEQGWYFFKFAAPVLLVVATAYTVSAKCSVNAEVNLYRNSTGGNWSRLLRTTTVGTLAAGDNFHVLKEWTAAATGTARVVTMDSVAATDYGDNVKSSSDYSSVGPGSTLAYGVAAATNYVLRLSTIFRVQYGATFTMGTIGAEIPRDSTAVLEFNCDAADGDFGLEVYGTWIAQGLSRSSGKNVVQCLLNTDEAVAQTVLGVDTDTGWLNGDDIAIASTTRTSSQCEQRTLNGNAGASSMTVTAGLTNAHSGTSPTQAEVILLSRNVQVRSTSTTLMAYVGIYAASTVAVAWTLFRYLGGSSTGERGIEIATTADGSCLFTYCAIRDFDNYGFYITGTSFDNVTLQHCIGYLVAGASSQGGIAIMTSTSGVNWEVSDCTMMPNRTNGSAFIFSDVGGTVQRIRAIGCGTSSTGGIRIQENAGIIDRTWSDLVAHSCQSTGITFSGFGGGRIDNIDCWRNTAGGLYSLNMRGNITLVGARFWGNVTNNVSLATGFSTITFRDCLFAADTTFSVTTGLSIEVAANNCVSIRVENCSFSPTSGIFVAQTNDIQFNSSSEFVGELVLVSTTLLAATPIDNIEQVVCRGAVRYQDSGGLDRSNYPALGVVSRDATIYRTAAPSENLAPTLASAGSKLRSQVRLAPVANGAMLQPAVYVRKDGTYAGASARLILLANPAVGVDDDVVLATHSAAADAWELMTGATPAATADGVMAFVVDCDGAAGNIYVDDWA